MGDSTKRQNLWGTFSAEQEDLYGPFEGTIQISHVLSNPRARQSVLLGKDALDP